MSELSKKNFSHEVVKSLTEEQFLEQHSHVEDKAKLKEIYSQLDGGSTVKGDKPAKASK